MAATQFVSEELLRKVAQRRDGVDKDVWSLDIVRRAFSWIRKNGTTVNYLIINIGCLIVSGFVLICAQANSNNHMFCLPGCGPLSSAEINLPKCLQLNKKRRDSFSPECFGSWRETRCGVILKRVDQACEMYLNGSCHE